MNSRIKSELLFASHQCNNDNTIPLSIILHVVSVGLGSQLPLEAQAVFITSVGEYPSSH